MRVLKYVGIVVVVLLLIVVALPFFIDANAFRPRLEAALSSALGREVKVGNLAVALWSGGVTAEDLSITDDPAYGRNPFLQAKSLKLNVELMPLIFSHQLNVKGLTIDQPSVVLLQSPSGTWNFSTLGGKPDGQEARPATPEPQPNTSSSQPLAISAKLVKITGGHFALGQANSRTKPLALDNVNLEVQDFAPGSSFPFSFSAQLAGGGQLNLTGKAGPIPENNADLTPVQIALHATQLDLARSGIVQPSTGFAGLVSLDAQGSSNGEVVSLNGKLKADKLKLAKNGSPAAQPVNFDFDLDHDLRKKTGRLKTGNIHFGSAPATLTGTYDLRGEIAALNMAFSGPNMAIDQLKQFLPAMDVVLPAGSSLQGGSASAKLTSQGPADALVTSGSLGVSKTRLAGFDLGSKMKAIAALAGMPGGANTDIQTLSADVRMAPQGTAINNFQLVVANIGQLTGAGTISPDHTLDFKMRATVHAAGAVLASLGQKGDASIPFLIVGTSSSPAFRPDVQGLAAQKVQQFTGNRDLGKAAGSVLNNLFGGKKKK